MPTGQHTTRDADNDRANRPIIPTKTAIVSHPNAHRPSTNRAKEVLLHDPPGGTSR